MNNISIPVVGHRLEQYFLSHVTNLYGGLYRVNSPLYVFKKTASPRLADVIVNLIIPRDALIYADSIAWRCSDHNDYHTRKMRASKAIVHSQALLRSRRFITTSYSNYDCEFEYKTGKTVTPYQGFSSDDKTCADGIHFFINLDDAVRYY